MQHVQGRPTADSDEVAGFSTDWGQLQIRDFYRVGTLRGMYGDRLDVEVLVCIEPGSPPAYVVRLRLTPNEGRGGSPVGTMSLDALPCMIHGLDFLVEAAERMGSEAHEYREVDFETKEGQTAGFYQKEHEQTAYLRVSSDASASLYFPTSGLPTLRRLIQQTLELLRSLGAPLKDSSDG